MEVQGGKLIYEDKTCLCTETGCPGQMGVQRPCKYMGRAVKGKFSGGQCPDCGATRKISHSWCLPTGKFIICPLCKGTQRVEETRYDNLLYSILRTIPLVVVRQQRSSTFNEAWLGIGCLYSSQDYGRSWKSSDEDVLIKVRASLQHGIQACHVVDESDLLPEAIVILVHRDGYSVRSALKLDQVALELSYKEGMALGIQIAGHGGNGTLAATGLLLDSN